MKGAPLDSVQIAGVFWIVVLILVVCVALRVVWLRRAHISNDMEEGNRDYLSEPPFEDFMIANEPVGTLFSMADIHPRSLSLPHHPIQVSIN